MKIAYVYDAVYPFVKGGGERRIFEIASRLSHRGHETHLFGMKYWQGADSYRNNGVWYHSLGAAVPLYHSSGRRSIRQALRFGLQAWQFLPQGRFDIVDCGQWPYFHFLPARLHSFLRRSHFVVSWYEVWGRHWYQYLGPAGAAGLAVERTFCRVPEKLIAVSEATRHDLIASGVPSAKVKVIPNGIEYKYIRSVKPAPDHHDIGYCGRLKNHKNIDVLLHAVAIIKRSKPDISAVIIGDGPERESLERLASQLGVTKNICFTGMLEAFDEVTAILKSCSLFIHPSTKEGGGSITLFEANACGLPVIAVRCENGIDPSLIRQGENGYFVEQLSPGLIAEQAIQLLLNSSQRRQNSEAALKMAANYDWDVIAAQHEHLYTDLLAAE